MQPIRHVRMDPGDQLESTPAGMLSLELRSVGDDLAQIEIDQLDVQLASFDLRKVEYVVDDGQQRFARTAYRFGVLSLLRVEVRVQQQARHTDHAVHRCADLMADHRHELALDAYSVFELTNQCPEVGDHALERRAQDVRRAFRLDVLAEVAL